MCFVAVLFWVSFLAFFSVFLIVNSYFFRSCYIYNVKCHRHFNIKSFFVVIFFFFIGARRHTCTYACCNHDEFRKWMTKCVMHTLSSVAIHVHVCMLCCSPYRYHVHVLCCTSLSYDVDEHAYVYVLVYIRELPAAMNAEYT